MKPHSTQIEHTSEFSTRRRALFPVEKNDSEQNNPLNGVTPFENFPVEQSVGDYDILGVVDTFFETKNTPTTTTTDLTPSKIESPTQKLKTPHDHFNNNTKLPKLVRKSGVLDDLNPKKIRTALFPDIQMPDLNPKMFYPQINPSLVKSRVVTGKIAVKRSSGRKENLYLCKKRNGRNSFGQINAGVRHKIRKVKKTKKKKVKSKSVDLIKSVLTENANIVNLSPPKTKEPSPQPDPNKKFFKSSRSTAVFKLNSNIQVKFDHGKVSVMEKKPNLKRNNLSQPISASKKAKLDDFCDQNETLIPTDQITNIIETLNSSDKVEKCDNGDVLMSPTSVMCDMASGLAINSPKKATRNLNGILSEMGNNIGEQKKLFPVFYPGNRVQTVENKNHSPKIGAKKIRAISENQMLLDAGQRKFGMTQCPQCETVYHQGDPNDEIMHQRYHNADHIFRFNGWKNERTVFKDDFLDAKIIKIIPADPKIWWKKVHDLLDIVNKDLGFYEIDHNTTNSQVFLYVKKRKIVGILVAELKYKGYKLLTTPEDEVDMCSEESYPIKCGISRIWVSPACRKQGIASAMMNSMRKNFMFGYFLRNDEIALSSPTQAGKIFGSKYFKTPNFFIYIN